MKITIDLEDFWLGDDDAFEEGLKKYILKELHNSVWQQIEDMATKEVRSQTINCIKKELTSQIQKIVKETIETGRVDNDKYGSDKKQITLKEWIKDEFYNKASYRTPIEEVRKMADNFAKDLKLRYDIAFANQIILKMNETGLLKDEAITKLLKQEFSK